MAARYVNPSNVVAQGQDFYTGLGAPDQQKAGSGPGLASRTQQMAGTGPGLSSGSYTGHGGGGGTNVMGRGSGGSAGVGADRTGSDSSKSWNYKPQLNIQIARDEEKGRGGEKPDPTADPRGGTSNPTPGPTPSTGRPRRPQQPAQEGEFVDGPEFPQLGRGIIDAPSWERGNEDALRSGEQPALTGTTTPSLSGPVQPRQLVQEVPSSRRDRINLSARERTVVNRGLRDLGASVKEQHGPNATAEDLMSSSDAMYGMRGATAGSRTGTRSGV